jgi:hypothetical protein
LRANRHRVESILRNLTICTLAEFSHFSAGRALLLIPGDLTSATLHQQEKLIVTLPAPSPPVHSPHGKSVELRRLSWTHHVRWMDVSFFACTLPPFHTTPHVPTHRLRTCSFRHTQSTGNPDERPRSSGSFNPSMAMASLQVPSPRKSASIPPSLVLLNCVWNGHDITVMSTGCTSAWQVSLRRVGVRRIFWCSREHQIT